MGNRNQDRWSRIFVLLIFVMLAAFAADRLLAEYGPITFFSPTSVANSDDGVATATATLDVTQASEYSFLDPTEMIVTSSLTPTPTVTPTPTLVPIYLEGNLLTTAVSDENALRPTPLAGVGSVISNCDATQKQYQYVLYGLASENFYNLTDVLDYLETDFTPREQAYEDGIIQLGLLENTLNSFSVPSEWLQDRLFQVLGVSLDGRALVIERFGSGRGVYWIAFEDDSPTKLLELSQPIEELVFDAKLGVVLLEVIEDGLHNLYFVRLSNGELIPATQFHPLSATHGRISAQGNWFAYETTEGVWVVNLDGSFSSLAVPGGESPEWSPTEEDHLMVTINGKLYVSTLADGSLEPVLDLSRRILSVESAEWQPDGQHLILWKVENNLCEWVKYDPVRRTEEVIFRFAQDRCRSGNPFQFSPDAQWMIGTVPAGLGTGLDAFDVLCDLTGAGGCVSLQLVRGNYFCHDTVWSDLLPEFGWNFDESDEGWRVVQQLNQVQSGQGLWSAVSIGDFPVINSPAALGIDADRMLALEMVMRVSAGNHATVYFSTADSPLINDEKSFQIPLAADGEFHRYVINLTQITNWTGVVNRIRIRLTDQQNAAIAIDSVRIHPLDG